MVKTVFPLFPGSSIDRFYCIIFVWFDAYQWSEEYIVYYTMYNVYVKKKKKWYKKWNDKINLKFVKTDQSEKSWQCGKRNTKIEVFYEQLIWFDNNVNRREKGKEKKWCTTKMIKIVMTTT